MNKMTITALLFSLALGIFWLRDVKAEETAGQILAKLNGLSSEKRNKTLMDGAKEEGEVTIYSSMRQDQLTAFLKTFNRRFPFLKVKGLRVATSRHVTRVQTEFYAQRHAVDVMNTTSPGAYSIKQFGALDAYRSPEMKSFPERYRDKEGYFNPIYVIPVVFTYNPSIVKREDAPRSYADLLDPKWKEKILLDTEDHEWFIVLLNHFGREKGLRYMKDLARQGLSMRRGRTLQTQMVMAGEYPAAIALHAHTVLEFKGKGAPIDWKILDPYFAKSNHIMIAKHAPHPHAAALFIDWALSEEGQSMIASFGRVVARKGIKQHFPELGQKEYLMTSPDMIGPVLSKNIDQFNEIFMR